MSSPERGSASPSPTTETTAAAESRVAELTAQLAAAQSQLTEAIRLGSAAQDSANQTAPPRAVRHRLPAERASVTHKFGIAGHEGYVTVGLYPSGAPGEIFIRMAKEGSTISGLMDSFATAVSMCLQHGVPLKLLCEKFAHTRFEPSGWTGNPEIGFAKSIMDYLFRWMQMRFLSGHQLDLFSGMKPAIPTDLAHTPQPPSPMLSSPERGSASAFSSSSSASLSSSPNSLSSPERGSASSVIPVAGTVNGPDNTVVPSLAAAQTPAAALDTGHSPLDTAFLSADLSARSGMAPSNLDSSLSFRSNAEESASPSSNPYKGMEDRGIFHAADAMKGMYDMGDAPSCPTCGAIMVRNGACHRCMECGSTSGCS